MSSDAETIRLLTEALQGLRATSKKPSLPAFDPKHVDLWVKRVESAYIRASVILPKEKFAFLEEKIAVDVDPKINEYLYGDHTEASWTEFLSYLRKRYGKTQQQKAQTILNGPRREGRKPSELLSFIKERADNVTLNQVLKEMVVRELPVEIQRSIAKQIDDLSAEETAEYADTFFDASGQPCHASSNAISAVHEDIPGLIDTEDEDEPKEVNAVGARSRPQGERNRRTSRVHSATHPPRPATTSRHLKNGLLTNTVHRSLATRLPPQE